MISGFPIPKTILTLNLRPNLLFDNVLSSYEQISCQVSLFWGLVTYQKSANLRLLNSEITISFSVP